MKRGRQQGFGHIEMFALIAVVLVLGLVSWMFISKRSDKPAPPKPAAAKVQPNTATQSADQTKPPILPEGFIRYTNDKLHFSFGYPESYGKLSSAPEKKPAISTISDYLTSQNPNGSSSNGPVGPISLTVSKPGVRETSSRKYGPMIKLKDDVWTVSQENASDVRGHQVGDTYDEFADDMDSPQSRGAGKVWVFGGGDEGCFDHRFVFVSQDRLIESQPPMFCDASAYSGGDAPTQQQFTANEAMLKAMVSSIWITK
jgi:hypothetical protein